MKMWIAVLAAALAVSARAAAPAKAPKALGPGVYVATVKALACEACGPKVVETLKAVPGVTGVSVDEKSRLTFTVKDGAKVDVAALQKKLKRASKEMGMGADYTLQDLKAASASRP